MAMYISLVMEHGLLVLVVDDDDFLGCSLPLVFCP
jgi:hypothetical protein